jgi:hypothetical protein
MQTDAGRAVTGTLPASIVATDALPRMFARREDQKPMNGPARDVALCEEHDVTCDVFERVSADGVIDAGEIVLLRRQLRQEGAALSVYSRERQILRTAERRGLGSAWVRRQLMELARDEDYLAEEPSAA